MLSIIQSTSFGLCLIAILVFLIVNDEKNERFETEFSYNLNKWHQKGSYLTYKNEHKIFYISEKLQSSSKKTTTLLFLHGFPSSSFDYAKIWSQFSDKHNEQNDINQLVTFDYLGYGFSSKPLNYEYTIFDMADMVDRLLLHLNVHSVVLVAHDVGDTVAQELIRRDNLNNQNNFKISKCILMNGGIMTDIYKPIASQYLMRTKYLNNLISSNYLFRFNFFKNSFSQIFGSLNQPNSTELYDFYLGIRFNNGNKVLPLTINYMSEREQFGNVWYDALNETNIPVLFIYGPADPINPRSTFPQKLRSDLPRVKLSILSELIGHYPQFEDYFTVFQLIKKFIN